MLLALVATSCCIHQWPELEAEMPEEGNMVLHLVFYPDFYIWEHLYDSETETMRQAYPDMAVNPDHPGTSDLYNNTRRYGEIRHIVRIYPAGEPIHYVKEIVLTNPAEGLYDCDVAVSLDPGVYDVVVWSDLRANKNDNWLYDYTDFLNITLDPDHRPNIDYRDAFRGKLQIVVARGEDREATVEMHRPMAKFEFIATGLQDFIEREMSRTNDSRSDLSSYKVVFTYANFMPSSYNAVDDRLVDSRSGVSFESAMTQVSDDEVSLGFDYVMINTAEIERGGAQAVSVYVSVYDPDGEQVAQSAPITVPLRRDDHTIVRSAFLSVNSQGGVVIDPTYDGDYNVFF